MGAAATLDKPFDLGMLRAAVLTILAQRGQQGLSGSPR
jgi:hypothetical protein